MVNNRISPTFALDLKKSGAFLFSKQKGFDALTASTGSRNVDSGLMAASNLQLV